MNIGSLIIVLSIGAMGVLWWIVTRRPAADPPIACYRCQTAGEATYLAQWETGGMLFHPKAQYTAHLCRSCAREVDATLFVQEPERLPQQQSGFSD